jgi:hypothetical protein
MLNPGMNIKHHKERGEWAEMRFMTAATEHGLTVTKPWGETTHYDFAVENDSGCFVRVQVKSTLYKKEGSYCCSVRTSRGPYTDDPFDFVAAYLIPLDLWYIIPAEVALTCHCKFLIAAHRPGSKYARYREAWHLLREKRRT